MNEHPTLWPVYLCGLRKRQFGKAEASRKAGPASIWPVYLRLLGATSIWAITFHVGRFAAQHGDPVGIAFLRFLVAGLTLAAIAKARGHSLHVERHQWPLVVGLAIPGVVAYTLLFLASVQTISGTRAALIAAVNPVVVEVASIVFLGASASATRWAGIALALLGAVIVLARGDLMSVGAAIGKGELYALGCMLAWALHTFLSRRINAVGMNSLTATTWSVLVGAGLMLIPIPVTGPVERLLHYPVGVYASVLQMAWFATALAFIWFAEGVRVVGPTRAAVFTNTVPVLAVLVGVLILGERLHWSMAVGGGLAFLGVWLTNRQGAAPSPSTLKKELHATRASC